MGTRMNFIGLLMLNRRVGETLRALVFRAHASPIRGVLDLGIPSSSYNQMCPGNVQGLVHLVPVFGHPKSFDDEVLLSQVHLK